MSTLEKAISAMTRNSRAWQSPAVDVRMQLIVTLAYIVAVVTVPLTDPGRMVWFLCFPIIMAEALGVGYLRVFFDSLWVLPLILLVGIFNPLIDREPLWEIGGVVISRGWVTFAGVTLRGLLSVQALLVLVRASGFNDMCRAFSRLGVPQVLVTQLQMLYRFMALLMEEALTMDRARRSRGFGRKSYPLKMWGVFAGQLLLRSIDRARRINRAMIARGFNGEMPCSTSMSRLRWIDWAYLIAWILIIICLRFVDFSALLGHLIMHRL